MRCHDVIATLKPRGDHEVLVPWSHYKGYIVLLTDGSQATLPLCRDCNDLIKPNEFDLMTQKLRFEWMRQQVIKYKNHPEKVQRIREAGNMCKSKKILRKF